MIRLLAQAIDRDDYLRSMKHRFSVPNPHVWHEILLAVGILAGLVGMLWIVWRWQRWRSGHGEMGPVDLYRHVLTRLDLPVGDLWRLWRLARVVRLPHPTAVLINATLFDEAVAQYCAGHGWLGPRSRAATQFATIRKRLFTE